MGTQIAKIEVENLRELRAHLRATGLGYEELKGAGLEAAQLVEDAARPKAPRLTGALDATIRSAGQASGAVVRVGNASLGAYPMVQHFGWAAHGIEPSLFLYDALDERRSQVYEVYAANVNRISRQASA